MENLENAAQRMTVLVIGNSGAGKSTLIKAIAGEKVEAGESTPNIATYDSAIWPIRLIDTKGFEYNVFEQLKTIWQVKKYTREQADDDDDTGIDAVWYCIDGTAKRLFQYNIDMMNSAVKRWKNIPVFAVITKSYSQIEEQENIEAVSQAFARSKGVNLQKIIPVVAEEFRISDEITVEPKGVEELCEATIDCMAAARAINDDNRRRMVLEQRRYTANALVIGATAAAAVVGAVPISFADSLILVPLEVGLTKGIFRAYKVDFSGELITGIVGSTAITNIARAAVSALKAIPVAGSVLNAVVAGFFVAALGESVIALTESIYLGKIDAEKIDGAVDFVSGKLKGSALLGFATDYLEKNASGLAGKNAKEIIGDIQQAFKKKDEK